jgi:beta-N-acetylhexosaminidase
MSSPRRARRSAALCLGGLLAVTACGGSDAPPVGAAPAPTTSPAAVPGCTPAPLAERAARVLVVGLPNVRSATEPLGRKVVDLGVGGLFMSPPKDLTAAGLTDLVKGLQERSKHPLLVSTDEESGRVSLTRAYVGSGPSPRRLAATRTTAEVRTYAEGVGEKLLELGINTDLAPVLDLNDGPSGAVIGDRSFSKDPARAQDYGLAFAAGLSDAGVTPTVKHFPGQGRSQADTDRERGQVAAPLSLVQTTDLVPFRAAIQAGAPVVMMSHLEIAAVDPTLPVSMSPKGYALLRSLGFTGVAITDSIGAGSINLRWDFPEAATRAVVAGADAVLATDGNQATRMRDALVRAVQSGRLPEARLNEAAARVTALSGEDPVAVSCVAAATPTLRVTG